MARLETYPTKLSHPSDAEAYPTHNLLNSWPVVASVQSATSAGHPMSQSQVALAHIVLQ